MKNENQTTDAGKLQSFFVVIPITSVIMIMLQLINGLNLERMPRYAIVVKKNFRENFSRQGQLRLVSLNCSYG